MCFVFFDSFPSPLIRGDPSLLHRISSLFDSGLALQLHNCAKEIASANAIRVNNCELSCYILLVVFDVLDVIKSVFFFCELSHGEVGLTSSCKCRLCLIGLTWC